MANPQSLASAVETQRKRAVNQKNVGRHIFKTNPRLKTVLLPKADPHVLTNYYAVPAIETRGTFRVSEMIPTDQIIQLAIFAQWLEKGHVSPQR